MGVGPWTRKAEIWDTEVTYSGLEVILGGGEHQRSIVLGDLKIPPYLSFNSSVCYIKLGMEASGTWM